MTSGKTGFLRFCRLTINLPPESRTINKTMPASDWTFNDEMISQIHYQLNVITALMINQNRKKGTKPVKPGKQFQPPAVEKLKAEIEEKRKKDSRVTEEEARRLEEFWVRRALPKK